MTTPKPSTMKKELAVAKDELAFLKKQNRAYADAMISFSEDKTQLKDDLARAMKGLLLGTKYEKALKEIRAAALRRQTFSEMHTTLVTIERLVNEALPQKSSITPELAAQMAKDSQLDDSGQDAQASRPTGKSTRLR